MPRVASLGVIDPQSTAQRVALAALRGDNEVQGLVHRVEQGQHRAGITRMALGDAIGKDKARGGLGQATDCATALGWTMAFALDDGGEGGIRSLDDVGWGERCALGQPLRWLGDGPIRVAGGCEIAQQTSTTGLIQGRGLAQEVLRLLGPGGHGTAQCKPRLFGLTHQRAEAFAVAPTWAAKAPQDLLPRLVERLSGGLQSRGRDRARRAEAFEEVQEFFCALYRVVASVTR